jgi:hypothetical protein
LCLFQLTEKIAFAFNVIGMVIFIVKAFVVPFLFGKWALWCTFNLILGVILAVIAGEFIKPSRKDDMMWGDVWLGVDAFHFLFGFAVLFLGLGVSQLHGHSPELVLRLLSFIPGLK